MKRWKLPQTASSASAKFAIDGRLTMLGRRQKREKWILLAPALALLALVTLIPLANTLC